MPTNCDSCNKPLWHMFKPPPAVECKRKLFHWSTSDYSIRYPYIVKDSGNEKKEIYHLSLALMSWVIHMKAIEQYFHVILFIMLCNTVRNFKFADKTLMYDHSYESYWAVLSCDTVYYSNQGG